MNYKIFIVNNKRFESYGNFNFATREEAERYAEGITFGLWTQGKKWAVVMLQDGEYDEKTMITKNLGGKQNDVFFWGLSDKMKGNIIDRLKESPQDKYMYTDIYRDILDWSEIFESYLTDDERRSKYGTLTAAEAIEILSKQ